MPLLRDSQILHQANTSFATFQAVEKTIADVVGLLMRNERLKRLLFYTDKHCLALPMLNQEQTFSLLNENIKVVPQIQIDPDTKPYIIITMDNFVPAANQTRFRSMTLTFDIICQYDHWLLDDFKLRPYSIAGEIDGMVNNAGVESRVADFLGAHMLQMHPNVGGLSLYYNLETFFDDQEPRVPNPEVLQQLKSRRNDVATRLFDS